MLETFYLLKTDTIRCRLNLKHIWMDQMLEKFYLKSGTDDTSAGRDELFRRQQDVGLDDVDHRPEIFASKL